MKTLIVLCCLVAASFASPFKFKFKQGSAIYEAIAKTTSRDTVKRDAVAVTFRRIDTNNDGHIDGNEYASYYANKNTPGLDYSRTRWRQLFYLAMPQIDTNGNEKLEIGEFRSLAERAMRYKKVLEAKWENIPPVNTVTFT